MHEPDTLGAEPLEEELGVTLPKDAFELIFVFIQDEFNAAATKLQKVYKSYHTRRYWADCAVVVEELWWKALDFAALKRSSVSFFDVEKQESAVSRWARARTRAAKDAGFNRNHSSEVSSPVVGHLPGYMDYRVGMRPQIPVERKWALGLQTIDGLSDMQPLNAHCLGFSMHIEFGFVKFRKVSGDILNYWPCNCCRCNCLPSINQNGGGGSVSVSLVFNQNACCQDRDDFGICCILPKFCTCSCPSYPSLDSNEYIWWKANARETKEELIDRERKFLD
ncbi:hypothetical protein HN873_037164 [Arachis hypogaea]